MQREDWLWIACKVAGLLVLVEAANLGGSFLVTGLGSGMPLRVWAMAAWLAWIAFGFWLLFDSRFWRWALRR